MKTETFTKQKPFYLPSIWDIIVFVGGAILGWFFNVTIAILICMGFSDVFLGVAQLFGGVFMIATIIGVMLLLKKVTYTMVTFLLGILLGVLCAIGWAYISPFYYTPTLPSIGGI